MSRRQRIFISSTSKDLKEYRQCVIEAIFRSNHHPAGMEYLRATDVRPLDECVRDVTESDRYVGIIAWRYGFIPQGQEKSITELEYEEAVRCGIPRHIFLLDEQKATWPVTFVDDDKKNIKSFRKRLEDENTCVYFETPDDLVSKMMSSIVADLGTSKQQSPHGKRFQVGTVFDHADYFLDRQKQMEDTLEFLRDQKTRFICVVGRGGYGKTALVSKVCLEMHDEIDGIVYMRCRGGTKLTLERVFRDFGKLLGGELSQELLDVCNESSRSVEDKTCFLIEALGDNKYIYALDNFEELMDSTGEIGDPELREFVEVLLTTCHNVKLIVTSRERPNPEPRTRMVSNIIRLADGLPKPYAIDLLRRLDSDNFVGLKKADSQVLAEIAERCKRQPRALQLCYGILQRKPAEFSPDKLPDPSELFPQQYRWLTEDERHVIEALAVLIKPVTAEVVDAVLRDILPSSGVRNCLNHLLRCFLVMRAGDRNTLLLQPDDQQYAISNMPGGEGKFSLKWWHRRVAGYYNEIRKPYEQWQSIDDIQPILDEIHHLTLAEDYTEAAKLADEIDDGHLFQWGCFRTLLDIREPLVEGLRTHPSLLHKNLGRLGLVYRLVGRRKDAVSALEKALEIAREGSVNDQKAQGQWLTFLGDTYADSADFANAKENYEKAISIARAVCDMKSEASSIGNLAILYRQTGRIQEAIDCYNQAITLDKKLKDKQLLCTHIGNMACSYMALGECEEAIRRFRKAMDLAKELNFKQSLAFCKLDMARTRLQLEEIEAAEVLLKESLEICETMVGRRCQAYTLYGLGCVVQHQDNWQEAKEYYNKGLKLDIPETNHGIMTNLGIIALACGKNEEALKHFEEAVNYCDKFLVSAPGSYEALYHKALAELARGAVPAALDVLQAAIEICGTRGTLKEAELDLRLLERARPDLPGLRQIRSMLESAAEKAKKNAHE